MGAVLVPLSTLLKPHELEAQLRGASVAFLVAARGNRGRDTLAELASLAPLARRAANDAEVRGAMPAAHHFGSR